MGRIIRPDDSGHTTIEWDVADERSVETARVEFERIMAANGLVSTPTGPGKSKQVQQFDPTVEEYFVISPMQGG